MHQRKVSSFLGGKTTLGAHLLEKAANSIRIEDFIDVLRNLFSLPKTNDHHLLSDCWTIDSIDKMLADMRSYIFKIFGKRCHNIFSEA